MKASKQELRREVAELRSIGTLMAAMCHNIAQPAWTLNSSDRKYLSECQAKWDAIKRAEARND